MTDSLVELCKSQSVTIEDAIELLEDALCEHDSHFGAVIEPTTHWSFRARLFLAQHANEKSEEDREIAGIVAARRGMKRVSVDLEDL